MHTSTKFLAAAALTTLTALSLCALFNGLLDNHGLIFNLNHRPTGKAFEPSELRVLKRNLIYRRNDYESAVFGTSRALYGFDCSHPFFAGVNSVNAAFPGMTFNELGHAVRHFIRHQRPRRILITLDYGSFTTSKDPFRFEFESAPAKHFQQTTNDLFITFLSADTLAKGAVSLTSKQPLYDRHAALDNITVYARSLKLGDLHQSFKKAELRCSEFWGERERQIIDHNLVAAIVEESKRKSVELYWLFTPYHHNLTAFFKRRDGLQPMVEWRREMANLLLELGEQRVFAWDSCRHLALSVDEIIQESGKGLPLFFEMSHFSQRLGNMMLDRLVQGEHAMKDDAERLIQIQPGNLNDHIQNLTGLWNDL